MKRIVFIPVLRLSFALSTASLISFIPDVTAESSIKSAFVCLAIKRARVVFPQPGVPHNISENNLPVLSKFNHGLRSDITLLCPKNSSRVEGRISSARGICLF